MDCIDEVRRQVFKRRVKTDMAVKKPYGKSEGTDSVEFEETLLKLA